MKKGKRILAAFLAVLMVVAIMPFTSFSGIFTSKAKAAESGKKYTFEGTELEAAAAGKYTDGQAVTASSITVRSPSFLSEEAIQSAHASSILLFLVSVTKEAASSA